MSYFDFNTAEVSSFEIIPAGTLAKVRLHITPGNYNDAANGWTGGYATRNDTTGAIYLSCDFTIMEGDYFKRKIWQKIGLYSDKNNNRWGDMGRGFIRSILNSAKGFNDDDTSEQAVEARRINSLGDLEGLEFAAKIDIEPDMNGNDRNIIKQVLTPEHKDYAQIMNGGSDSISDSSNVISEIPDWA